MIPTRVATLSLAVVASFAAVACGGDSSPSAPASTNEAGAGGSAGHALAGGSGGAALAGNGGVSAAGKGGSEAVGGKGGSVASGGKTGGGAGGAAAGGKAGSAPAGGAGGAAAAGKGGSPSQAGGSGGEPGQPGGSGGAPSTGGTGGAPACSLADADCTAPFLHPGVLVSQAQLDVVKAHAAESPWSDAISKAKKGALGKIPYTPTPRANVECGSFDMPDNGCSDERKDAEAAYTDAVLFHLTGDAAYETAAIGTMNAWSAVLTEHTNSNAPLQSAWSAAVWSRAAELIRAFSTKWSAKDQQAFGELLKNVYLPEIIKGSTANGNWELSMAEAVMGIGVFLDDHATFAAGVDLWRNRVPAYFYLASDGPAPVTPPHTTKSGAALDTYWYSPGMYVDGLCQETCRDLGHVQLGVASLINGAETAHLQHVDLYGEQSHRIAVGLEYNAAFLDGVAPPDGLCAKFDASSYNQTWEIALNNFAGRDGLPMPHVTSITKAHRPSGYALQIVYETLTHYGVGQ